MRGSREKGGVDTMGARGGGVRKKRTSRDTPYRNERISKSTILDSFTDPISFYYVHAASMKDSYSLLFLPHSFAESLLSHSLALAESLSNFLVLTE